MPTKKTKECPFCWEEILESAKKCKHCWEFLDGSNQNIQVNVQQPQQAFTNIIKYKSWIIIDCPACWYSWKPKKNTQWNIWIEIVLWLFLFPIWICYSIWRLCSDKTCKCPTCWNEMLSIHRA